MISQLITLTFGFVFGVLNVVLCGPLVVDKTVEEDLKPGDKVVLTVGYKTNTVEVIRSVK